MVPRSQKHCCLRTVALAKINHPICKRDHACNLCIPQMNGITGETIKETSKEEYFHSDSENSLLMAKRLFKPI